MEGFIMQLDEQDLRDGLKLIVGTWQVDYLVNAFSNDLAHIPATEFKSDDGRDFTAINYEFFEDHTMVMRDTANNREIGGTWEQTGWGEFHYTINEFFDIPDDNFRKAVETLQVIDGDIVFSIGFLAVAMKKIKDGTVTITKKPDIGDMEMNAEDAANMGIVGRYAVAKTFSLVNDTPGLYSREEVEAYVNEQTAAGKMDPEETASIFQAFNFETEFTEEHTVDSWMKAPETVSEADIKKAVEAGEIIAFKDGYALMHRSEWKCIGGKFYYNTNEHREVFGEEQSPWDELTCDEDGYLNMAGGMIKLKKL